MSADGRPERSISCHVAADYYATHRQAGVWDPCEADPGLYWFPHLWQRQQNGFERATPNRLLPAKDRVAGTWRYPFRVVGHDPDGQPHSRRKPDDLA